MILTLALSLVQCKSKNEDTSAMETIGSVENEVTDKEVRFTLDEYKRRSKQIIENGKKILQRSLPNSINKQLQIIKTTLYDVEGQSLASLSYSETNLNIELVQARSFDYLLTEELKINQIYYEIVNELVLLNDEYFNYWASLDTPIEFVDYYEVTPIILAGEDVLMKIDELIQDEDERSNDENNDMIVGIGVSLITLIPGTSLAIKVLQGVKKGAQVAKNATLIAENGTRISKITSKVLNQKTGKIFTKALSNLEKRSKIAKNLNTVRNVGLAGEVVYNVAPFVGGASLGYTISHFKSAENKIEGRIGDFSDGILSQAIGQLRKISSSNEMILQQSL
jgi:hypothetical protein